MKIFNKYLVISLLTISFTSCEFDLLDSPNEVGPTNANIDFLLANSYLTFNNLMTGVSNNTMGVTRLVTMQANVYTADNGPQTWDAVWSNAYANLIPDLDLVIVKSKEAGITFPEGVAKVLKAYAMTTMVDIFGDVPYTEAFLGTSNFGPKADKGADIYAAADKLLDEARTLLAAPTGTLINDLYYGGSAAKWLKLANTLKVRAMINQRLIKPVTQAQIDAVIGADGAKGIAVPADDFKFQYGSNREAPDARHPFYSDGYENLGPGWYQSNFMMWTMILGKGDIVDPRVRYYYYRQDCDEEGEDAFTLPCIFQNAPNHYDGFPFCTASADKFGDPAKKFVGYWGRDHGDGSGIPPDGLKKTAFGVYPAGGKFDADNCAQVSNAGKDGLKGVGINPIMMSSWVKFMLAENTLANGGDASALLEAAVKESVKRVMDFGAADAGTSTLKPTQADVDAYVAKVKADYAASSDKMNVLITEYWLDCFGNGIEPYNFIRRTCKPAKLQPALDVDPGPFPRSQFYPGSYVSRNQNASQKANQTTPVFWDNNPAGCVK
jgi:hypothetical protein